MILNDSVTMATRETFWFYNIRKKCCVASASSNVPRMAVALLELATKHFFRRCSDCETRMSHL